MRSRAKASMSASPPETRKCALCGKPQDQAYRPFCSKRCADIDLGRVNILVGFAPLKPAEFVIVKLQQMAGQLSS